MLTNSLFILPNMDRGIPPISGERENARVWGDFSVYKDCRQSVPKTAEDLYFMTQEDKEERCKTRR